MQTHRKRAWALASVSALSACSQPGVDADASIDVASSIIDSSISVGNSTPTTSSLEAAQAALAAGADEAPLSADGSLHYRRVREGDVETLEEVTLDGAVVARWEYAGAVTTIRFDREPDGRFERTVVLTEGATEEEHVVEITEDLVGSGFATTHDVLTPLGGLIHVLHETGDGSAPPDASYEYDAPMDQQAVFEGPAPNASCSMDEAGFMNQFMRDAHDIGNDCLHRYRRHDVVAAISRVLTRRGIRLVCDRGLGAVAEVGLWQTYWRGTAGSGPVTIDVNPGRLANRPDDSTRRGYLYHELTHFFFGLHDTFAIDVTNVATRAALDPMYACQRLCFGDHYIPAEFPPEHVSVRFANRCECAQCLGTTQCDPRCEALPECPDTPHRCPCTGRVFSDPASCLGGCPSTLACMNRCVPLECSR